MKTFNFKVLTLAVCTGAALTLTACGSDNSDNNVKPQKLETVTGTAAVGAALAGAKIEVVNKSGQISTTTAKDDGTFSVDVKAGAPYMVKASKDNTILYSYTPTAGYVNINQLTTQAMFSAADKANLEKIYDDWAKQSSVINQTAIDNAAKQVAANLQPQFSAAEINAKTLNIFNYKFTPNHTGFDAVLDKVQISGFNSCNVSSCIIKYTVNGVNYGWNYTIDTTGYNLTLTNDNGGGFGGNQNLKITTSVSTAGISTPDVVVNIPNIDKPTNEKEFCTGSNTTSQLPQGYKVTSCTFNGTTGNIAATVSANGFNVSYTVKYEYSPA